MQKILFVSPSGLIDNGAEIAIVNLMSHLSSMGYEVHNVFPNIRHIVPDKYDNYLETLKKQSIHLHPLETVHWWWLEAFGKTESDEASIGYQKNIADIKNIIRENHIDLVITNTVNMFQGAIAAATERVPHFWFIHENPEDEFSYYKEKIDFISENSDQIFTVTGYLYSKLNTLFNRDIKQFIPYSRVTVEKLKAEEETRIVSIGRVNDNKNQFELLEAYELLKRDDIPLVFIGDWDEEYKIKCDDFIKENSLTNVHFLGYKKNPWQYVSDKDICVLTSKKESFGLVYVESLLNGIPTIVSDNTGYQSVFELFGEGDMYPLGNIQELKEKILNLLENFGKDKLLLEQKQSELQAKYTIENCYSEIIHAIQNFDKAKYKEKELYDIRYLFGEYTTSSSNDDQVTIYYSTDLEGFSEERTLLFPIDSSSISFQLDNQYTKIRIDLTEHKSFYQSVILTSKATGKQIFPVQTNAIRYGSSFLFKEDDPQIIYEILGKGEEFLLEFQSLELSDIHALDYVGVTLVDYIEESKSKINQLEKEQSSLEQQKDGLISTNNELNTKLEELLQQYHAVINSRRWTISTKIINFFRRKK